MSKVGKFVASVPVIEGSKAESKAVEFKKWLEDNNLQSVCYRTGRSRGWSYDLYVMPNKLPKPTRQSGVIGDHVVRIHSGYFVSGIDNAIIEAIETYMHCTKNI